MEVVGQRWRLATDYGHAHVHVDEHVTAVQINRDRVNLGISSNVLLIFHWNRVRHAISC
jgi:hypothetical protein